MKSFGSATCCRRANLGAISYPPGRAAERGRQTRRDPNGETRPANTDEGFGNIIRKDSFYGTNNDCGLLLSSFLRLQQNSDFLILPLSIFAHTFPHLYSLTHFVPITSFYEFCAPSSFPSPFTPQCSVPFQPQLFPHLLQPAVHRDDLVVLLHLLDLLEVQLHRHVGHRPLVQHRAQLLLVLLEKVVHQCPLLDAAQCQRLSKVKVQKARIKDQGSTFREQS